MKTKKMMLSMIAVLGVGAFLTINAYATTYYVRDGGGTATQCTGTTNAVYPGTGTAVACAFNHPRWALGWDGAGNNIAGKLAGGDTLYINGDSDVTPGAQAQYLIGYDDTGKATTPNCNTAYPWDCTLNNIPAGTSGHPTSIIGTGTHKPQLWGNERPWDVLDAENNYIALQWLEITDHQACAKDDPRGTCNYSGSYPYGAWAEDGLILGGSNLTLTDVYVHGLGRYGINVSDNATTVGNVTFTRVYVVGNGQAGITTGINAAINGTWTFNQPIIEWNGCVEAYPVTAVDNPSNYSNCFGQGSGGYGDGVAFGNDDHGNAGNWTFVGPGSVSFNVQDGLDTLHGNGNGTILIDKMRFEGNGGNQIKINAQSSTVTNSIVIGDCGWWYNAPQSLPGGMQYGDACRALGNTISYFTNAGAGTTNSFYNNTIIGNGDVQFLQNGTCDSSDVLTAYNNIILGGYQWPDDSSFNSAGGNTLVTYIYQSGTDGDGAGCANYTVHEDYNIVKGHKNNNAGCNGPHDKCGVDPAFTASFPMGSSAGAANTFYQGNSGASLVSLANTSPAATAGMSGLTFWNNSNDYHNAVRTSTPSIGGLEKSSCAANASGCLFNSDCCSGTCSLFTCTGSTTGQPTVGISNPVNGSIVSEGTNIPVTVTASETSGSISNINLYNGQGVLLGSSKTSPYTFIQSNPVSGDYTYTAQATDASGVSATSSAVTVTVKPQSILPSPPSAGISSPGGNTFKAGSNVTLTATGSETNGTITKISIFNGAGVLLGTGSTSPYSYVANNLLAGTYTFTAQATDALGVSATSSPVTITVTALPSPVVALTSPANGSAFSAGTSITLTSTASETNGTISRVDFYNGTTLLGTSTSSPYSFTWNNVPAGSYNLTAVATDGAGVTTASSMISITVNSHTGPTVTLTAPPNGTSFMIPANLVLAATASDSNATITRVDFYNNGSLFLGSSVIKPYRLILINVAAGVYNLTAKATDSNGATAVSSPVTITVGSHNVPVVSLTSPTNNASFNSPASIVMTASASETNGIISKVDFYNGTTLLGTDTSSPYTFTWSNVAAGSYSITARATDSNGNTSSSPAAAVSVTSSVHVPPTVSLTSPANNASFTSPASVTITASASATNASVTRVDFYNGSTLLGSDTVNPYTFTWSNVAAGSYNLKAVVTDSTGATAASSAVTVVVTALHAAPTVSLTSPANNASFTSPASVTITASASATNASLTRVDFYNGTTLLGSDTVSPYTFTWSNVAAGSYNLTAVVTDSTGATATSSTVAVVVNTLHAAPTVSLTSPANNASFTSPASVTITASASATNASVTRVDFYNGSTLLGSDTVSPYTFTWNSVGAGSYNLKAVVTDSTGATATSATVAVVVNAPQAGLSVSIVAPPNGAVFTRPISFILSATATDSGATVTRVDYYNGSTFLGSSSTSPFRLMLINAASGTYTLTAKATDSSGATATSAPVTVTVH